MMREPLDEVVDDDLAPPMLSVALVRALAAAGLEARLPDGFDEGVERIGPVGLWGLGLTEHGDECVWTLPAEAGRAMLAAGKVVGDAGDGVTVVAFRDFVASVHPSGDDAVMVIPCIDLEGRDAPRDMEAFAVMGDDRWIGAGCAARRLRSAARTPTKGWMLGERLVADFLEALPGKPVGSVSFGRMPGGEVKVGHWPVVPLAIERVLHDFVGAVLRHPVVGRGWMRHDGHPRLESSWFVDEGFSGVTPEAEASSTIAACRARVARARVTTWLSTAGIGTELMEAATAAMQPRGDEGDVSVATAA